MKAHLSPLYLWSAATSSGTVAKLPDTVILVLQYLLKELSADSFLVSAHRPFQYTVDQFRADAKCTDDRVVIAGWECTTLNIKEEVVCFGHHGARGTISFQGGQRGAMGMYFS